MVRIVYAKMLQMSTYNVAKHQESKLHIKSYSYDYTGHFIMFPMITNIYNKKTKGPTLMELFTATGKLIPPPN
jgi:hypothetical protein